MNGTLLREILRHGNYITINKLLIKRLGIECAYFFSHLIEMHSYFEQKNELDKDNGFYCIQGDTVDISRYQQRKYIKILEEYNLLDIKLKGLPAKNYYYLNWDNIEFFLDPDNEIGEESRGEITTQQATKKLRNNPRSNLAPIYNKIRISNIRESNTLSKEDKVPNAGRKRPAQTFSKVRMEKRVNHTSKKTKEKYNRKKTPKPKPRNHRNLPNYVESIWNAANTTTTHRQGTKRWNEIVFYLSQLIDGTFMEDKHFDKKFLETLPKEFLTKKWSPNEIKVGLEYLVKYTTEGYWPKEKKQFKSLPKVLYNENSGKSMFLKAMADPPKPISESGGKPTDNDPQVNAIINSIVKNVYNNNESNINGGSNQILFFARDMSETYNKLKKDRRLYRIYPTPAMFAKEYFEGLNNWEIERPSVCLNKNSNLFKNFVEYVKEA